MVWFPDTAPEFSSLFPVRDASHPQPERSSTAPGRCSLPATALEEAAALVLLYHRYERRHAEPTVAPHRTATARPGHGNFECRATQADRSRARYASQRHLTVLAYSQRARRRYGGLDSRPRKSGTDAGQSARSLGALGDRRVSRSHSRPLQPGLFRMLSRFCPAGGVVGGPAGRRDQTPNRRFSRKANG